MGIPHVLMPLGTDPNHMCSQGGTDYPYGMYSPWAVHMHHHVVKIENFLDPVHI